MKSGISSNVILLTVVNFLFCFAEYVSLPVLALHFNLDFGLSFTQIGILLGTAPVVSACLGFLGASAARRLGAVNSMVVGLLLLVGPYLCYAFRGEYPLLLAMAALQGLGRVFWEPVIKSLFTFHARESTAQDRVFRIKYCTICLGAIIGPLVGGLLSTQGKVLCIVASAVLFGLLAAALLASRRRLAGATIEAAPQRGALLTELRRCDPRLALYIAGNTLVFFAFTQFETMFALSLKAFSERPETLFSYLMVLNAAAGITLQLVVVAIGGRCKTMRSILLGNVAFAAAFSIFALAEGRLLLLVAATILFTLGEVVVLPGGDMIIDEIAPDDKKTLYFGLAEIRLLGFAFGPACAGAILEYGGVQAMFFTAAVVVLLANALYYAPQLKKRLLGAQAA